MGEGEAVVAIPGSHCDLFGRSIYRQHTGSELFVEKEG